MEQCSLRPYTITGAGIRGDTLLAEMILLLTVTLYFDNLSRNKIGSRRDHEYLDLISTKRSSKTNSVKDNALDFSHEVTAISARILYYVIRRNSTFIQIAFYFCSKFQKSWI